MGGTNITTPRGKRSTPGRRAAVGKVVGTPNGSEKKRRRASDFASKKPSARKNKRRRSQEKDEEGDLDNLIDMAREVIEGGEGKDGNAELRNAFVRAKEASEQFGSDSSSDDGKGVNRKIEEQASANNPTVKNSNSGQSEGSKQSIRGKEKTPKKTRKTSNGTAKKVSSTPVKTPGKSMEPAAQLNTSSRKLRSSSRAQNVSKAAAKKRYISKTASAHKADIEALKKDDPDFYSFLHENDPKLLNFDESDDDLLPVGNGIDESGEESANESGDNEPDEIEKDTPKSGIDHHVCVQQLDSKLVESDASEGKELEGDVEAVDEDGVDEDGGNVDATKDVVKSNSPVVEQENIQGNIQAPKQSPIIDEVDLDDSKSADGEVSSEDGSVEDAPVSNGQPTSEDKSGNVSKKAAETAIPAIDEEEYSDDSEEDEDEERAEAEAAAEAGIQLGVDTGDDDMELDASDEESDEGEGNSEKKVKKVILVDMAYLRNIQEQLNSSRSCLKAAKDLLRLFRAGRDILPIEATTVQKKDKFNKKKVRKTAKNEEKGEKDLHEMEDEQFADDGSFTSGQVKFVSAKAYQHAMNLAITGIQDALDRMLGKPQAKKKSSNISLLKWEPSESNRWSNLQPVFRPFVFHLISLCDSITDPNTLRFLLKRLERLIPYTQGNKELLQKVVRTGIRVWSSDELHVSEATRLRAYLLLNKLAHGLGNAETVLRSCCSAYATTISSVCNPRTLPRIHFASTCVVELFGIDMGASYTTAFANLREMAVSLRAVLVSKDEKDEVERIHNWSYINRLRLWSKVLGRYGSEEELRPLIYPYVQVALGVMRVHATPRTYPLRLHVASYLSDLVSKSGIFIPLTPHLLHLLRCSELRKKPAHGSAKAIEWRSVLRVSNDAIKTKPFLSGVISGVILQLAKFFAAISKHVSFPELAHVAETTLRKFAKEVQVPEWKGKLMALVQKLRQTSQLIADIRAKADFSPHGAASPEGMLAVVPGLDREMKTPIQRFYEVECTRVAKEERLRDENVVKKMEKNGGVGDEDDSSGSDSEAVQRRAKKRKPIAKKQKAPLTVIGSDDEDEEDVVEELHFDSDESDE